MAAAPGCFVGWQPLLLLAVLVVLQGQQLRADFGLPTAVLGGNLVVRDANGINGVLNAMDRAFRRFNPTGQTDRLIQASAVISQIALNVTELGRFDQTRQATEKNIVGNQQGVKAFIDGEKDTTVKRYTNTRNAIIADISNAVGKLNVFGTNQTLLALSDKHSEEYTKIYYYLFNRNESDIQNISSAFDAIGNNMEKIVVDSSDTITGQSQQTVDRLAELFLARSVNSEICYNKYSGQVINTFPGYQNGVVNCMTREKNRLGRITDVMDRMLQLILSTSQDLANNVASCTVWNGFDKSETVYRQAEACLHTNINEMAKFGSIIGRELDLVQTLGDVEVAASRYRLYDCVAARNNEALATIYVLNKDIDGCVSEPGLQRDVLGGGEKGGDEDTEDPYEAGASTTEEPVYDEYLMEVFSNSSSFGDDVDKIM
ncbi:hypothetical protein quinque_011104 [Culex quinquefasciatus]